MDQIEPPPSGKAERIAAAFARDTAERRYVTETGEIPPFYEAITAQWLTANLAGSRPGATVTAHSLDAADNGTSNRRRIFVEWNEAGRRAGLPGSVFCKATTDLANRLLLSASATFSEVSFYNRVRSDLQIDAPQAYFAGYDPNSWASIIVLHDMADQIQFCSEQTVSDRTSVESQLSLLASMHGRFYNSARFHTDLSDLIPFHARFRNLSRLHGLQACCEAGLEAAIEMVPPRLFARRGEVWAATVRSVDWQATQPETFAHGDVHLKNWYCSPNGTMGLGDWQCSGRGHWARDVAYVIATALEVEQRRTLEPELLRFYLDALGASGGPRVSIDVGWVPYRAQMLSALAWWTMTLTPSQQMPDMQPVDTTRAFLGRLAVAVDDLDSIDAAI